MKLFAIAMLFAWLQILVKCIPLKSEINDEGIRGFKIKWNCEIRLKYDFSLLVYLIYDEKPYEIDHYDIYNTLEDIKKRLRKNLKQIRRPSSRRNRNKTPFIRSTTKLPTTNAYSDELYSDQNEYINIDWCKILIEKCNY